MTARRGTSAAVHVLAQRDVGLVAARARRRAARARAPRRAPRARSRASHRHVGVHEHDWLARQRRCATAASPPCGRTPRSRRPGEEPSALRRALLRREHQDAGGRLLPVRAAPDVERAVVAAQAHGRDRAAARRSRRRRPAPPSSPPARRRAARRRATPRRRASSTPTVVSSSHASADPGARQRAERDRRRRAAAARRRRRGRCRRSTPRCDRRGDHDAAIRVPSRETAIAAICVAPGQASATSMRLPSGEERERARRAASRGTLQMYAERVDRRVDEPVARVEHVDDPSVGLTRATDPSTSRSAGEVAVGA